MPLGSQKPVTHTQRFGNPGELADCACGSRYLPWSEGAQTPRLLSPGHRWLQRLPSEHPCGLIPGGMNHCRGAMGTCVRVFIAPWLGSIQDQP